MSAIQQYSEVVAQIKELTTKKDELGTKILDGMKKDKVGTVKTDYGTFSMAQKLVYEYPEDYKLAVDESKVYLKDLKEEAEKHIKPTVKKYLTFRLKV